MVTRNPVKWVQAFAAIAFPALAALLAFQQQAALAMGLFATGIFVLVHLGIETLAIYKYLCQVIRKCEENASNEKSDPSADSLKNTLHALGVELQKRLVDSQAPYRDVAKHYVATAGVILGIIVGLAREELITLLTVVGVGSLIFSIGVGLILLERVSGNPETDFERNANAIMYHLMCWLLLLGLILLALGFWILFSKC